MFHKKGAGNFRFKFLSLGAGALLGIFCMLLNPVNAFAAQISYPNVNFYFGSQPVNTPVPENTPLPDNGDPAAPEQASSENNAASGTLQLLFLVLLIALVPSILIVMTCFTRIIIVLHFVRSALGTQQMPPNQVLIGLALFLTLFIMAPAISQINETAFKPLSNQEISTEQAFENAMVPMREFMFRQVQTKDLALFSKLAGTTYNSFDEIPNTVLIPAYIMGEVTQGFKMGFMIYMPFIVIDMIVASTLMAMGMMMLPPAMISLPFKILLFIMVDGWNLVISNLVKTFR